MHFKIIEIELKKGISFDYLMCKIPEILNKYCEEYTVDWSSKIEKKKRSGKAGT